MAYSVGDDVLVAWTGNGWRHPDYWKVDNTGTPTYLDAWHRTERVALARVVAIDPERDYRFQVRFVSEGSNDLFAGLIHLAGPVFHIEEEFVRPSGWIPDPPERGDF